MATSLLPPKLKVSEPPLERQGKRFYTVSQKSEPPYNHGYNFVNSW